MMSRQRRACMPCHAMPRHAMIKRSRRRRENAATAGDTPTYHPQRAKTPTPKLHLTQPPVHLNHAQSQPPSFHPVRHLSSHLPQSNTSFPSFRLTSLCASHSQFPNAPLPSTLTSRFCMYS